MVKNYFKLKFLALCCPVFLLSAMLIEAEPSLRQVPLTDEVYRVLSAAKTLGYLDYLSDVRPYSVTAVARYLEKATAGAASSAPAAFKEELRRHAERFRADDGGLWSAALGEDSKVSVRGETGLNTIAVFGKDANAFLTTAIGAFDIELSFGDRLYLNQGNEFDLVFYTMDDTDAYPAIGSARRDLPDYAMYEWKLDTGENGFASNALTEKRPLIRLDQNAQTQVSINAEFLTLTLGRGVLDWGPSAYSNLCLSRSAESFDHIGYTIDLGGRGAFSWMTGFLRDSKTEKKLVAAHRLEYQLFDWLSLALYESVLYEPRFELAYINPMTTYYGTEVNIGDWDNKLGGLDAVFTPPGLGAQFYISLFADDWDAGEMLDFSAYHNIGAYMAGARWFSPDAAINVEAEYVYCSHWMYTHRDEPGYGYNKYTHEGVNFGHVLGPNSHMARLSASWRPAQWPLSFGGVAEFIQKTKFTINDDLFNAGLKDIPDNPYFREGTSYYFLDIGVPGSVLESVAAVTLTADYAPSSWPVTLSASYGVEYAHNLANVAGSERWRHLLSLSATAKL